jgi:ABC-2 type transport system ATP-binding protein
MSHAAEIAEVSHRYGSRVALDSLSLNVPAGQLFGLLGPNGGGKSTLFRLLCTLFPPQSGRISVLGLESTGNATSIRRQIGVTFQSPSLDRKLTVVENLRHQGRLYGLSGAALQSRIDFVLQRLGIEDRRHELAERLSGGLQRRVEIAKSLLHEPRLLLLDEPSTGLDPGARLDLIAYLRSLVVDSGVSVLLTTHLMEEAEKCDRLAVLDRGRLVAEGTPAGLRSELGGDCVTLQCRDAALLAGELRARLGLASRQFGDELRIEATNGLELLTRLLQEFGSRIDSISLARPTLEDVFVAKTGHRFRDAAA